MATKKFDKSAAFKSIIGVDQLSEQSQTSVEEEIIIPAGVSLSKQDVQAIEEHRSIPLVTMPSKQENRNQRRQVFLTKTLAEKADTKQKAMGISFNEVINQLLQKWVDEK